jgi:hypothetical protein
MKSAFERQMRAVDSVTLACAPTFHDDDRQS